MTFGELDYSSDDINEVQLTFRYDWADVKVYVAGGASANFDSELET